MLSTRLAVAAAAALIGIGAAASTAQAQFTVFTPADSGPGSLRRAINNANANANLSRIEFNLPAITTITPLASLPAITAPVELDGFTQPGVVIDVVNSAQGLAVTTNGSLIRGLTIHDSSNAAVADGIQVTGNGNRLEGNNIGTDVAGASLGFTNLTTGVVVTGDQNVVKAGVIAESNGDGLAINGDENIVVGSRIGLPVGGGLGNALNGVSVTGDENQIGTMNAGDRNIISENNAHGALIAGNHNRVEGNYVGLDDTGAAGPGNVTDGVHVVGNENLVRGNSATLNNAGVFVDGTSNTIMGNTLDDNDDGVLIVGGNTNLVGGDEPNVITGNGDSGVEIEGGQNHRVENNDIGSATAPNDYGVRVESSFNLVVDNTVTANADAGIKVDGDAVGPPPLGNLVDGNEVAGNRKGVMVEDSHNNGITDNAISGSLEEGVLIEAFDLPNANGNWLTGNTITGSGLSGVRIEEADENLVGLPDAEINTITGNGEDGVTVETGQDNAVVNNSIYGNDNLGIDLAADGVTTNDGLLDADPGPNGLQNHPSISDHQLVVVQQGGLFIPKSRISWTLRSAAATDYRLEFYANDTCAGRGEAKELVATRQVTTDATGLVEGSIDIAPVDETVTVSATETDAAGLVLGPTSELSQCG